MKTNRTICHFSNYFIMNTLSTLTIMPENKDSLALYTANLKAEILAGNENPLKIAKLLKALEEIVETLRSDTEIKDYILTEALKYKEKSIKNFGAEFQVKEVGTKYDFTACDDEEWFNLDEQIKALSEKKKARETFLKGINSDTEIYGSNGVKLNPPTKTSQTSVTVKLL